ncbi:hypothetical protein [Candidatus Methylacidiphilum fumarolicum]|uniref:hypothetical protein n=1 Tax=Candidatus Methylacidiphilum fumarolicum TaxID=591154 RepID=UPI0009A24841
MEPITEPDLRLPRYRGGVRWVWNKALALQKQLEADYLLLSYYEHAWSLALWRHSEEYGCLYNAPTFPYNGRSSSWIRQSRRCLTSSPPARFQRREKQLAWEIRKLSQKKGFLHN